MIYFPRIILQICHFSTSNEGLVYWYHLSINIRIIFLLLILSPNNINKNEHSLSRRNAIGIKNTIKNLTLKTLNNKTPEFLQPSYVLTFPIFHPPRTSNHPSTNSKNPVPRRHSLFATSQWSQRSSQNLYDDYANDSIQRQIS
jgi:hypothetical protein